MTNQQGAPEALRPIARYKIGYHTDEWGMRSSTPSGIPDPAGAWVRYEDHVAALLAQRPAPSVAVALSDDLRDRLVAISEAIADQDDRAAQAMLREILAAPQPSTTPPADSQPCPTCAALARTVMLDQVSFDRKPDCYGIRQITDDEGIEEWEDIRTSPDVAREEANDMMATGRGEIYEVVPLWTTPQPSPTPQADSQPAPVLGEPTWTVFNSGAQVAEVESLAEAMEYLTPERLSRQWCAVCVVDQANMPKARAPADSAPTSVKETMTLQEVWEAAGGNPGIRPTRADVLLALQTLDEVCDEVCDEAQADSVTAPAGGVGAVKDWAAGARFALEQVAKVDRICWLTDSMREIGITQAGKAVLAERDRLLAAQAADSVLEDAARLAKIMQAIRDYHFALDNREHGGVAMARAWNAICDVLNMDWVQGAESAARKQGGAT